MYTFFVLSCVASVAFAGLAPVHVAQYKTIVEPHVSVVETPTVSHVGSVVKSIPTGHSYQSQTQYHSKQVVQPIYAHGVEKKFVSTPVVKSVVEHVPVVRHHHVAKTVIAEPLAYHHAEPLAYHHAEPLAYHHAYPVAQKIVAAPAIHYASAPAHYAHHAPLAYAHSYHH